MARNKKILKPMGVALWTSPPHLFISELLWAHVFVILIVFVFLQVDLSSNLITSVPSHLFPNTLSLMVLRLSHNPIPSIQPGAFSHLRQLTQVFHPHFRCLCLCLWHCNYDHHDHVHRKHFHISSLTCLSAVSPHWRPGLSSGWTNLSVCI